MTCGRGADEVNLPSAATVLDATCEDVWVPRKLPADLGGRTSQRLRAYPSRVRAALTYTVGCSAEEDFDEPGWAKLRCAGEVTLRQAAGRERLLASGTIPRGRLTLTARMRLTATGRRLATRPHGVPAVLHIRGQSLPDARWTIQLKLPAAP